MILNPDICKRVSCFFHNGEEGCFKAWTEMYEKCRGNVPDENGWKIVVPKDCPYIAEMAVTQ